MLNPQIMETCELVQGKGSLVTACKWQGVQTAGSVCSLQDMQQHTDWERSVLTHLSSSSELAVHKLPKENMILCKQKLAP